jgi:hypothetical protein
MYKCVQVCARALQKPVFLGSLTRKTSSQANAHRSFADPTGEMNDIKKKHREKYQFGKKILESVIQLYCSHIRQY